MSIFKLLGLAGKKTAANVARERLKVVLSHERSEGGDADFLPKMRNELLMVISKYVKIDQDQINVQLQRNDSCSILELNVMLPAPDFESASAKSEEELYH